MLSNAARNSIITNKQTDIHTRLASVGLAQARPNYSDELNGLLAYMEFFCMVISCQRRTDI